MIIKDDIIESNPNKIEKMFDRDDEKELIDCPSYQTEQLGKIFDKLERISVFIDASVLIDEQIDQSNDELSELDELIDHNSQITAEHFIFLFSFIKILYNHQNELKNLENRVIYITNKIANIYPELVDELVNHEEEMCNFVEIFSGIFMSQESNFLMKIIEKSDVAFNFLLENCNLLNTIFKGVKSTALKMFPEMEKDKFNKATDISYEYEKLLFNYWGYAMKTLEKIATVYSENNSVQTEIFKFSIQFLKKGLFDISEGFFFQVVDCISACILHFDDLEIFDIDEYIVFLVETLKTKYFPARESIFKLFKIVTQPPFLYKFYPQFVGEIIVRTIEWYKSNDYQNYMKYFTYFVDFISNVIVNQNEILDALNSINFLEELFSIFENESYKLKSHIMNLFMNLSSPNLWPKTITFYVDHHIVTELILLVTSAQNDEDFAVQIINCLFQISDVKFLDPYPTQKVYIISEFQSEIVEESLESFEMEQSTINEMIYELKNRIKEL